MISIVLSNLPPSVNCGVPFVITVCVTSSVAGIVTICASLPGAAPCQIISTAPAPGGNEKVCVSTSVQSLKQKCVNMTLSVDCGGQKNIFTETLTVTATNIAGESSSDITALSITC